MTDRIVFEDVSKFYGEVLGVNRVSLTSAARHHHARRPQRLRQNDADEPDDRPRAAVKRAHLRARPRRRAMPTRFFREVGYCTQFDSFPRGLTGWHFLIDSLLLYGMSETDAIRLAREAIERVRLSDAAMPQDRRLQQRHAAEDSPRPGHRAPPPRSHSR